MSQYEQNWQCRNAINCGCCHISDQSEEDGELCQDCYDELQERENRFAGLVAENAKLKEELAAYKNANDPMGGGLRSLEWRFVWHGSGGNENWNRRGGRIFTNLTNGDELLYVGENKSDLEDAHLLIAKHNADLLFVAQSKQAQIDRLKAQATALGQMLQTCLSLPVRGQPCVLDTSNPNASEYKHVYWMDAVMDCLEANTAMVYDREMAYLSALPPSQYHKAVKKLEKERAAKKAQEQTQ